jgi:Spy/CpxP family protein refolding chaperone
MKKHAVLIAIVLMAFNAPLFSQPDNGREFHRIIAKLNLTDEQKKDVKKIDVDMAKQVVDQRANLATARIDLRQLFQADNPDKAAIEKKINEMADIGVQLQMVKINSWFAINKLLTPDQQKAWKKALANAPAVRRQGMLNRMHERFRHAPQGEE